MSGSEFDTFTKTLAARASRRAVLTGLAGMVAASLAGLARTEASAAACRKLGQLCHQLRQPCCPTTVCDPTTHRCVCAPNRADCNADKDDGCETDIGGNDPTNCGACRRRCKPCEVCQQGRCVPKNCSDNNPCTTDSCDPRTGQCRHAPVADGTACPDDGKKCTRDVCRAGQCVHPAVTCPPCQTCDRATGQCVADPSQNGRTCDDGNKCTDSDVCRQGVCAGNPKTCDDGNPCTRDRCEPSTGACVHESISGCCRSDAECADGNPCTQDLCEPDTHRCRYIPAPDGVACPDDGDPCTEDICNGGFCIHRPIGGCCRTDAECADGSPCTEDRCEPDTHRCRYIPAPDGVPCPDDGDPCTDDTCNGGYCVHRPKTCDDGDPCTIDTCDPSSGACLHHFACDDEDPCTLDFCFPNGSTATCVHQAKNCDDSDPCTIDVCDATTGNCVHRFACDDGDPCTLDLCFPNGSTATCVHEPKNCDDGDPCTVDFCDSATGNCAHRFYCDDGDPCTLDLCFPSGSTAVCVHQPRNCDDGDPCTTDFCDAYTGECVHEPIPDCTSGCTSDAACDDGDPCTTDVCDPYSGQCLHEPIPGCGSGCTADADCDDADPCTEDVCEPYTGTCVHSPQSCDDGNECTSGTCEPYAAHPQGG